MRPWAWGERAKISSTCSSSSSRPIWVNGRRPASCSSRRDSDLRIVTKIPWRWASRASGTPWATTTGRTVWTYP